MAGKIVRVSDHLHFKLKVLAAKKKKSVKDLVEVAVIKLLAKKNS